MSLRKLLICSPSAAVRGGVETIISDLCRGLPAHGWEPLLGLGKGSRFNDVAAYRAVYHDLPILEIDGTSGTRHGRMAAIRQMIGRVRPDVVLSARIFDAYEVVASLKQRANAPRLAITIRGYEPGYLFDARLYQSNIDLCVVDGNLLAAACKEWCGLDADKVVSIPGGVRPAAVPRSTSAGDNLRLGYVGRLAQSDKRALDLVPLVNYLDEHKFGFCLKIVGEGPEEVTLREQLKSFVASGRVTFHGWKTIDELYNEVYPNLDCLVNFSPAEGVTIAGREGMTNGVVPVIARFVGLESEGLYVHEFNALTFPVGDTASAANSIIRLRQEPGLLAHLKTNAAKSQSGKYSYGGALEAWANALDRCIEREPARGPVPDLRLQPDGRLAQLGVSPGVAHWIRRGLHRQMVHTDPGSEWPQGSGLLPSEVSNEIWDFAARYEMRNDAAYRKSGQS